MEQALNPFSFKGKLARGPYWMVVSCLLAANSTLLGLRAVHPDVPVPGEVVNFVPAFLAVYVGKRMRDFGLPALVGWLSVFFVSFILPLVQVLATTDQQADVWPAVFHLLENPARPINLAAILLLLFITGIPRSSEATDGSESRDNRLDSVEALIAAHQTGMPTPATPAALSTPIMGNAFGRRAGV